MEKLSRFVIRVNNKRIMSMVAHSKWEAEYRFFNKESQNYPNLQRTSVEAREHKPKKYN